MRGGFFHLPSVSLGQFNSLLARESGEFACKDKCQASETIRVFRCRHWFRTWCRGTCCDLCSFSSPAKKYDVFIASGKRNRCLLMHSLDLRFRFGLFVFIKFISCRLLCIFLRSSRPPRSVRFRGRFLPWLRGTLRRFRPDNLMLIRVGDEVIVLFLRRLPNYFARRRRCGRFRFRSWFFGLRRTNRHFLFWRRS